MIRKSFTVFLGSIKNITTCKKMRFHDGTGGPRYMREIGTPKIGSHIMNSHIKIPRNATN